MLEEIIQLDQQFFIWLNGFHAQWLDPIMLWITGSKSWIPFYLVLTFLIARKQKWNTLYVILGVALVITACDQFTSSFMKPYFGRLRPCYEPVLDGMVHMVKGCGGRFGYASSHAANTFGLATFLWFLLGDRGFNWFKYLFIWAAIVSYSRIYVGVHYPADILTGALVGIGFGYLFYRLYLTVEGKYLIKKEEKKELVKS
jgi:undecaprenyl-diphosphatase